MAAEERPDVLLLTAADEFFEVGDGSDLVTAIEEDVMRRLRHYSHREVAMDRGVSWAPGVDFSQHLGHRPVLPGSQEWRASTRLYVSRRYPLRSPERVRAQAHPHRAPSRPAGRREPLSAVRPRGGGHTGPAEFLTRYEDDHRWVLDQKVLAWRLRETTAALGRAHLRIEELEAERRPPSTKG